MISQLKEHEYHEKQIVATILLWDALDNKVLITELLEGPKGKKCPNC